jgi:hypothetical protein
MLIFFSIQKNLQKITPEEMGFEITDFDDNRCMLDKLYNTGCLRFRLKIVLGKWNNFCEGKNYFVDEQFCMLCGITALFEATESGTKMTDVVHYAPLGSLVA